MYPNVPDLSDVWNVTKTWIHPKKSQINVYYFKSTNMMIINVKPFEDQNYKCYFLLLSIRSYKPIVQSTNDRLLVDYLQLRSI